MTFALGCENLRLEYASKLLFDGVTLGVDEGARIGIVGRNGDGKTTLLNLLSQQLEPDEGRVFKRSDLSVAVLSQDDHLDPDSTVVESIFGDEPEYVWASDPRIRDILDNLISNVSLDSRIGDLSGGERRRVDIARVLVGTEDILFMDEPTNHLDMVSIDWLAGHLNRRWPAKQGVLLVVTHDRWFLDEVCTSMWEVHDSTVEPFEGGYSAYVLQRVERDEAAQKAEAKRQNLMRRELAWLSRGARARATKPKFHVEQAQALIAEEPPTRDSIELKRTAVARLGKRAVEFVNVSKSYGGRKIIDDVSWNILPGDRVGLLGENGAGKTTLLKMIEGKVKPDSGWINIGKTVKLAVLSQRLEELDEFGNYQVREVLSRYKSSYTIDGKEVSSTQLLERLGFKPAEFQLPVSMLSGGQKRRLQLMLTLLQGCNVMILDEPGNDMDIDMLSQIENVLDTWPGTLIMVSHDRNLLEHVTDNQYAIIDGKVIHMPKGVEQYLRMASSRKPAGVDYGSAAQAGSQGSGAGTAAGDADGAGQPSRKLSNQQRQAAKKKLASCERKLETLQSRLAQAKDDLASADQTDYLQLQECEKKIEELEGSISEMEDEWLETSMELEDE